MFLTNQIVEANGYVTLAPRMSEWFSTPPQSQFGGVNEWYDLLVSHEGRHVVQFDKMDQGFTRIAGFLFGDQGRLAFSFLSVPVWWWEGDAVGSETALTNSGRGRQPSFDMGIRTLLLSGRRYSYYKSYLGSYKDYCPNYYELGYQLATHVKRSHGPEAWSRVIDRSSRFSFYPFIFSMALKKETGRNAAGTFDETMDELEFLWKGQLEGLSLTEFSTVNSSEKTVWTSYVFPHYGPDSTIIVQKTGLDHPVQLVRLYSNGREEKIGQFAPREFYGTRVSAENGKLVWDEMVPDPRWGARNYSVIMTYDLESGRTRRLTRKTRLLNPALSPDGKRIAAVEFTPRRQCAIVILDVETGKELKRLPNLNNDYIMSPSWSADGKLIVFTRQKTLGRALSIVDVQTGEIRDAIPYGWEDITFPAFYGKYILYGSAYSGIDNIYAVDTESGRRYQVTSSKFGAFFPEVSPDGKKLLFSTYTVDGFDVAEMTLDPSTWKALEEVEKRSINYYEPLIAQEQGGSIFDDKDIPKVDYCVKDYHPITHVLNIHSWNFLPTSSELGLELFSNDKLNTTGLNGGMWFNVNEKTSRFSVGGSYAGLFPVLDFELSRGGRASTYTDANNRSQTETWRETSARLGLGVPLNLSRGIHATSLILGTGVEYTRISDKSQVGAYENGNGSFIPVEYHISFSRFRDASLRDIHRPGLSTYLTYSHTPWKGDYKGSLLSTQADVFLPGGLPHHALHVQAGYEQQRPQNYHFASRFLFPRGYDAVFHEKLYKASLDYALPLLYPDWAFGPVLYLRRVTGNVFYDYGLGEDGITKRTYRSVGTGLAFDVCPLSLPVPFAVGVRYVYRIEDGNYRIEPVFGVNF
ncbi:MAG: hypothetical protein QME66_06690 [Candidatus Eisenbacteria bacterium]|nr:hypothetical protein [Candidatus Eisenbacteria bacterium]